MYVEVGDLKYWCEVYGKGPPVVLLHGFTGSSKSWHQLIDHLKGKYQLIAIDLPGHGQTEINTPRTMEDCCADLKSLFNVLKLSAVHLVGYSMGGRTALSFAMLYPQYVETLTLESASPGLYQAEERSLRVKQDEQLIEQIKTKGLTAFVHKWENIPLFHTQRKLPECIRQKVRSERLAQSEEGLIQSLRYMGTGSQPSWWGQLNKITCPVLLIVGALDQKFVTINQQMQKEFQHATLKIVNDAGHTIHLEKFATFKKILTRFIDEKTHS